MRALLLFALLALGACADEIRLPNPAEEVPGYSARAQTIYLVRQMEHTATTSY